MSLFGVVELGSHTFRYLVAEYKDGVLVPILRGRSYVGLGKRLQRDGSFGLDAYDASIKAVEEFLNEINSLEPLRLWAIATGVIRDAKDRERFLAHLEKAIGCNISLLEGREEARLSLVGASYSFRDPEDVAVFDIGGGSVEIGIRSKGEEGYISIPFGCLVLLKRFPGCETDQARWNEMREFWAKELRLELQVPPKDLKFLIGTGGTMVSLAALKRHLHLKDLNPGLITGTELALEELEGMKDRLFLLPLESRGELPGLDPERAAPIMPGIAIVLEILSYFQKEKVVVSFEDLLEGVLVTNLRSQGDGT